MHCIAQHGIRLIELLCMVPTTVSDSRLCLVGTMGCRYTGRLVDTYMHGIGSLSLRLLAFAVVATRVRKMQNNEIIRSMTWLDRNGVVFINMCWTGGRQG